MFSGGVSRARGIPQRAMELEAEIPRVGNEKLTLFDSGPYNSSVLA